MKPYYVMIHWDRGSAVTGFVAPQAKDPKDAVRLIKKSLLARKKMFDKPDDHGDYKRTVHFLKSLKRPWRINNRYKPERTVVVEELIGAIDAGYWLSDAITGRHICNQANRTRNQF